jgi:hypothetical protein
VNKNQKTITIFGQQARWWGWPGKGKLVPVAVSDKERVGFSFRSILCLCRAKVSNQVKKLWKRKADVCQKNMFDETCTHEISGFFVF